MAGPFPMSPQWPVQPGTPLMPRMSAAISRIVVQTPPSALRPAQPRTAGVAQVKPFLLLPSQPSPEEATAVQEHLLQRPLTDVDQAQQQEFLDSLNVTVGDYAPGGENHPGDPYGGTKIG